MPSGENKEFIENRTRFSDKTPEERAELGRKGGIKSGESKRRKKAMRETFEILLSMPMKPGKGADVEAIKNFANLKGKNISVQEAMAIAQIQKALKGDTTAATFVRDTVGEKPNDNVTLEGTIPVVISGDDELED